MNADGYLLVALFFAGWILGLFLEYLLHWIMHRFSLRFHIGHHREFFHLAPRQVALNTIDPRMDIWFFLGALALASPLMLLWGWAPVLCFWGGAFWHVVIVYEACHGLMHHDSWAPEFMVQSRAYRWWKGCHFEHHFHSPAGNFSVTFPLLDKLLGTYIAPRSSYAPIPNPKLTPPGDDFVLPVPIQED